MADVGRPLKFESPEQLSALIDKYFDSITRVVILEDGKRIIEWLDIPSMVDLADACDCHVDTLYEYRDNHPGFSEPLKRAKQKIESFKVKQLYKVKNPAGCIFDLKVNHGYVETQHIDMNVTGDLATSLAAARQRAKE